MPGSGAGRWSGWGGPGPEHTAYTFLMTKRVHALYEDGVLRPLEPLEGVAEHSRVRITIEMDEVRTHPLADCIGTLPDDDAREMMRIIEEEFERVDAEEWS